MIMLIAAAMPHRIRTGPALAGRGTIIKLNSIDSVPLQLILIHGFSIRIESVESNTSRFGSFTYTVEIETTGFIYLALASFNLPRPHYRTLSKRSRTRRRPARTVC